MALHIQKTQVGDDIPDADIYEEPVSQIAFPKYQMPDKAHNPDVIVQLLKDELMLDGNAKQNLATFCTTYVEPQVHDLMDLCLDKNMIDKDEYPQTAELEARCVHMLAELWNSPASETTIGCSTTGSSEACMLGGLAMKWRWRKKRAQEGKDTSKPNLVCGSSVQICWKKFARYFDVEFREIPLGEDEVSINPDKIRDYVDENTICVVPILGITYTCAYDPIKKIAEVLDQLEKETGLDVPIHVDGASGAFIAPFVQPELLWDFQIPRVKSISTSGHKFGLAPLGVGWVVWREQQDLPEELIFYVDYLGGNMPTFALNFSRPGGQIVAQYYNFMRLGFEGYKNIQQSCLDTSQWLANRISELEPFKILYDGNGGLPALSYTLKPGDWGFDLYDLSDQIRVRGWQIAAYPLPANRESTVIHRILIRHGVSRDLASLLFADIKRSIEYLLKHPKAATGEGRPSFSHI